MTATATRGAARIDRGPHHHATITAWTERYGDDMADGSAVTWTQNGWRWTAHRRDGTWHIVGIDPAASPSSAAGHTWVELCSRLSRMSARAFLRHLPAETVPLVAPVHIDRGVDVHHRPVSRIPLDRFPNIGAFT